MLEEIPSRHRHRTVYRFASLQADDFLTSLGLDAQSEREMEELLDATGYRPDVEELCDAPFRLKRRFRRPTRFSDGSFPVFYSALELATAEAEVQHWFRVFAGTPGHPRTAYYQRLCCIFDGLEKDLHPKHADWPELVHDHDYTFCNRLGAEAKRSELDGLVSPSARRHGGANMPIFRRQAIRNPQSQGLAAITYDASSPKADSDAPRA